MIDFTRTWLTALTQEDEGCSLYFPWATDIFLESLSHVAVSDHWTRFVSLFLPRYIPVLLLSCGTCTVTVLTLCACVCSLFFVYVCTHTGSHVCMHACLPFFARPQCLFIAEQMYIAADANVVVYPNVFAQLWQGRQLTGRVKGTSSGDPYQGPLCYHISLH